MQKKNVFLFPIKILKNRKILVQIFFPRTCAAYSEPVRARPGVGAPPVGALLRSVAGTVLVAPGAGVVRETEGVCVWNDLFL